MYKAIVEFTKGWGYEKIQFKADSYKEINEKVNNFDGKEITVVGRTSKVILYKVTFLYPSGKKFVKRYNEY